MTLKKGMQAPDFHSPDQKGKFHTLGEFSGRKLLLYFYPKDDTPGCTKEACGFRDNFDALSDKVSIVGVSEDFVDSHADFAKKYSLTFPLLSDPDRTIIEAYGANGAIFAKRSSFLIGENGKIIKVYPKVNPSTHAKEVLKDLG
jgi:peroxiredoxin Q/BCP